MLSSQLSRPSDRSPVGVSTPSLAIVVPSCDSYSDVWPSFFRTLFRQWPDCPFPVHLVTNNAQFTYPRVALVPVGADSGWSANLKKALDFIAAEYILVIIDDLYPTARIDTSSIVSLMAEVGPFDYLRLNPHPGPRRRISRRFGLVPPGDIYRTSTVFSIWRRKVLQSLLRDSESAWEFELNGSSRSDHLDRWFASRHWLVPYLNLVIKRKIDPMVLRRLRGHGVSIDSPRPCLNASEAAVLRLRVARSKVFGCLPWTLQRRLRGAF